MAGDTLKVRTQSLTSRSIKTSPLFGLASKFTIVKFIANQNRQEAMIELEVKDRDRAVSVTLANHIQKDTK